MYETDLIIRSWVRRRKEEIRSQRALAYDTAQLTNAKRLPKRERWMGDVKSKRLEPDEAARRKAEFEELKRAAPPPKE